MRTTTSTRRTEHLHAEGSAVELRYAGDDSVTLRLHHTADADADLDARLLCAAVSRARRRSSRRAHTVVDASGSGATVLAALRERVGADLEEIRLRRAGSSVMVTLDLLPLPAPARPARRVGASHAGRALAGHAGHA